MNWFESLKTFLLTELRNELPSFSLASYAVLLFIFIISLLYLLKSRINERIAIQDSVTNYRVSELNRNNSIRESRPKYEIIKGPSQDWQIENSSTEDEPSPTLQRRLSKEEFQKRIHRTNSVANRLSKSLLPDFSTPQYSHSGRKLRRRERALILAKRMMRLSTPLEGLKEKSIPNSMLDPELSKDDNISSKLPEELAALYNTVRIFGHFEKPVFLNLCKHMKHIDLRQGEYLFRRGEADEYIYVVQSGHIDIFIRENAFAQQSPNPSDSSIPRTSTLGNACRVAEAKNGDSIHSLLSILDVLNGHMAPYKTVSARAVKESKILRLPVKAMADEFKNNPDALIRLVQIIAMRLQRVTLFCLHNYLGLTSELMTQEVKVDLNSFAIHDVDKALTNPDFLLNCPSDISTGTKRSSIGKKQTRFAELEQVKDGENEYERHSYFFPNELNSAMAKAFAREDHTGRKEHACEVREFFNDSILEMARQDLITKVFGLEKDSECLNNRLTLLQIPSGTTLTKEGEYNAAMYFVVKGKLSAFQSSETGRVKAAYHCSEGMVTGQLAVLTGEPSFFDVKAVTDCLVVRILKSDMFQMLRDNNDEADTIILNLSHSITQRISPFVRQIDFALDWITLESGHTLFKQNDRADATFIVLNGRLRSVANKPTTKKYINAEYGKGDIIGLSEMFNQNSTRLSSVHAVRDTELARIPDGLLNMIRKRFPHVTTRIAGYLGSLMDKEVKLEEGSHETTTYGDLTNLLSNLSTVAVIPSNESVPLDEFTKKLESSVENICPVDGRVVCVAAELSKFFGAFN